MRLIIYIIIGFIAQMIDGTLGMAYGVSCRTFLTIFTQVPSNIVSAIVHYTEIPSSLSSMISHIKLKNIDKKIFLKLVSTGIIGSVIGTYIVILNFNWLEFVIDIYLIYIGIIVLKKGLNYNPQVKIRKKSNYILGFVGGFFDASGGGYGPIVTGNLLANNNNPKKVIGTVNSSEFFITLSSSITFMYFLTNVRKYILIIIGLIIGGIIASPIAAKLCLKLEEKKLYIIIGILLIILNVYNIIN